MLIIWASVILILSPLTWAVDEPVVLGSEVKVLPSGTSDPPPTPAPLAPAAADPFAELPSSESPKTTVAVAPGEAPPQQPAAAVSVAAIAGEAGEQKSNATAPAQPAAPASEAAPAQEKPAELPAANTNATLPETNPSPSLELESNPANANANVTAPLETKPAEPKPNASLPIDAEKKPEENPLPQLQSDNSSIAVPHQQLANNETIVDLNAAASRPDIPAKNETQIVKEIISNNTTEFDLNSTSKFLLPSKIDKIRLTIIGFTGKPVHTFNLSEHQILYQMKVFWGEPETWQDIGYQPSDRLYELFCWLTVHGGYARDLFRGNLSSGLDQHSQWYAFPEADDTSKNNISVNCGLRPVNGAGKGGDWTFSEPAPVREAPVFLRGFENVNVRGWTKDEVIRLIRNQKRNDSPQKAQAKAKSKSRRS